MNAPCAQQLLSFKYKGKLITALLAKEKKRALLKTVKTTDIKAITVKIDGEINGYNSLEFGKLIEFLILKLWLRSLPSHLSTRRSE